MVGIFKNMDDLKKLNIGRTVIDPKDNKRMNDFYNGWKDAINSGKARAEVLVNNF